MIFRRAKHSYTSSELDEHDRRQETQGEETETGAGGAEPTGPQLPSGDGPYDADEVGWEHASKADVVDLGGLGVRPRHGMELRLQVDEKSKAVVAAVLLQDGSGVELRAFAAPRSGGLWEEIRREVAAEATRRGGVATDQSGRFGAELSVVVPTQNKDGKTVSQTTRVAGVDGPRWFLRATFMGRAAVDPEVARPLEEAMADVIVVRGKGPMAPREMIPLKLPPNAQQRVTGGADGAVVSPAGSATAEGNGPAGAH